MRNLKGLLVGMTVGILMVCIFVTIFSPRYKASKLLSTDLPRPVATQWSDNHGGFFGDGELYGTLIFNESNKKALDEHLLKKRDRPAQEAVVGRDPQQRRHHCRGGAHRAAVMPGLLGLRKIFQKISQKVSQIALLKRYISRRRKRDFY